MNTEQLTEKIIDHESRLSKHTEDIKTLFEQQKAIKDLAESTQCMATNIAALTEQVKSMNTRVSAFEEEKAKRGFAIWQIVASAALGAAVTFIVSKMLG